MTDFVTLAASRESCRNYDPARPVEREKLERCLEAARLAPSAVNSQPWFFTVVTREDLLPKVADCLQFGGTGINQFSGNCRAFAVAQRKPLPRNVEREELAGRSLDFTQLDLGIAVAHFCLEATDQGLSTCIMGWMDEAGLKKALDLPEADDVRVVIGIGYAADETLRPKKRKAADEMRRFLD